MNEIHELQVSQASASAVRLVQLIVLARIRAQVVLPTPRGPQKRNECASCSVLMAFFRVVVICDCPTTVLKCCGRYLIADTTYCSAMRVANIT